MTDDDIALRVPLLLFVLLAVNISSQRGGNINMEIISAGKHQVRRMGKFLWVALVDPLRLMKLRESWPFIALAYSVCVCVRALKNIQVGQIRF